MVEMSSCAGKVAVVTGAGSGIGRELARGLARRGARLALSDVDGVNLEETAVLVEELGSRPHTAVVDVADRDVVEGWAHAVAEHFGVVHQVFNNAGVAGNNRSVLESDLDEFQRVLGINLWGTIHTTKAFLPHLVASGAGHVVNISSVNGILPQANSAPYCASKFAVRGFTESLRSEMLAAGLPVVVSVVHPGGVRTNIANASLAHGERSGSVSDVDRARVATYNEKLLRMPAERAASIILDGVEKGRPRILVGRDAKVLDMMVRWLPRRAPAISNRIFA